MRIALVNLSGGGLSGGNKKYLRHMVPALRSHKSVSHLEVFIPRAVYEQNELNIGITTPLDLTDALLGYRALKQKLDQIEPDVVFVPNALGLHYPKKPVVVMPRNMEMMSMAWTSGPIRHRLRNGIKAIYGNKACRNATRVIAISQFVGDFLTNSWKIKPAKVGVVYFGVDDVSRNEKGTKPAALTNSSGPFFFTAGGIIPYRGLEDIIRAMAEPTLRALKIPLVIAGELCTSAMTAYQNKLLKLVQETEVQDSIIWAGQLNSKEMIWSYQNCNAFIMSSRIEACPNIALEAMSWGCRIISTRCPPMPEFFGNTTLYYDANNYSELAEKMREITNFSETETRTRAELTLQRAAEFSWNKTANQTIKQLQFAINDHKSLMGSLL